MTQQELDSLPTDILIEGCFETREVYISGRELEPWQSLKHRKHSPDGFDWSYGGSGPAQLALAILLLYLSKEEALNLYQLFKLSFITTLPKGDFEVRLNLQAEILKILPNGTA